MISRDWWEHLAPKVMHRRRTEIEPPLLRQWCGTEYGAHWLGVAKQEGGVIRTKPGDFIPVVHFIALGDRPVFIAPQNRVKEGLRTVGPDQFKSGHTLEAGELALGTEAFKGIFFGCGVRNTRFLRLVEREIPGLLA
jgi:hypothetical protein